MSPAPSLPPQLIYSTDLQFYIDELRTMYNGRRIQTYDNYEVAFYLNRDFDCEHVVCGKGKRVIDYGRAKRTPFIEYILVHDTARVVRLNKKTRNICFVSRVSRCVVICSVIRSKELKFITMIYDRSDQMTYLNSFDNHSNYQFL